MDLDDEFTDGPYAGEMVEDLIEDQPWYIEQLVNEHFQFSDAVYEKLRKAGIC